MTKPNVWGKTRMRVRLSRVECREYSLRCRWCEVPLDHSDTIREAWVCTRLIWEMMWLYVIDGYTRVKRYSYVAVIIDNSISWTNSHFIRYSGSTILIGSPLFSWEPIPEVFIPIRSWMYYRRNWRICESCLIWVKISWRQIDSYKNHECNHRLNPLDTILSMLLVLRMFHNFYKKNKNIITYKNTFVNYISILFISVKYIDRYYIRFFSFFRYSEETIS